MKKFLSTVFALLLSTALSYAGDHSFVLPKCFKADITYINPIKGESRYVNGFYLEMQGESAAVYLPYVGELYSAPLPGEGLDFEGEVKKLKYSETKKGDQVVEFEMVEGTRSCKFIITAYDNNTLDLEVIPANASACSYRGNWEEIKK